MTGPDVAAVVLAAGRAARWRASGGVSTKLVADWKGAPMVRRVVEAALASRAAPVIVVTGSDADAVRRALGGLDVRFVDNPRFAEGMASSLAAGLGAAPASASGALVLLGDMPEIKPALIDALIAAFAAAPHAKAVAPTFGGERGNPVLLARALFEPACALQGDRGARGLLAAAGAEVIDLCVSEQATRLDIDTVEALRDAGREGEA